MGKKYFAPASAQILFLPCYYHFFVLGDIFMLKKTLTLLCMATAAFAVNFRQQSPLHPGDFPLENVPQFVFIGADDCAEPEAIMWLVNFLGGRKNPDGSPVLATFFVNGRYAQNNHTLAQEPEITRTWHAWKRAYKAGHEIGNHTYSHWFPGDWSEPREDARLLSVDRWNAEIISNDLALTANLEIPRSRIVGFRAPFLEYNRAAFEAMIRRGFLYDSSIEEGMQPDQDGTNRFWPYQITEGSIIDSMQAEWSSGANDWGYKGIGKFPNSRMWILPVYAYIVPHDSLAGQLGFKRGLRSRVQRNVPWFNKNTGNITGFDFNLFAPKAWGGAQMRANETLATMKHTFHTHLSGNRAPVSIGMHPDYYMPSQNRNYRSAGNHLQRRKIIEDFVNYVLQYPEVRIVTGANLIAWMQNPVPLNDNMPVLNERGEPSRVAQPVRTTRPAPAPTIKQQPAQETQEAQETEEAQETQAE